MTVAPSALAKPYDLLRTIGGKPVKANSMAANVRGVPQVVFKQVSGGGTWGQRTLGGQMEYILGKAEAIFDSDKSVEGKSHLTASEANARAKEWVDGWSATSKTARTSHLIASFPAGTNVEKVKEIMQDVCYDMLDQGKQRFSYVAAIHTDNGNPHCHIIVERQNRDKELFYLAPGHEFSYDTFKDAIVERARQSGIELCNTSKLSRGLDNGKDAPVPGSELVDFGEDKYNHDPNENESYFVTIRSPRGIETTIWGKDLQQAIANSGVQKGDKVNLDYKGKVEVTVKDRNGNYIKTHRNEWEVTPAGARAVNRNATPAGNKPAGSSTPRRSRSLATRMAQMAAWADAYSRMAQTFGTRFPALARAFRDAAANLSAGRPIPAAVQGVSQGISTGLAGKSTVQTNQQKGLVTMKGQKQDFGVDDAGERHAAAEAEERHANLQQWAEQQDYSEDQQTISDMTESAAREVDRTNVVTLANLDNPTPEQRAALVSAIENNLYDDAIAELRSGNHAVLAEYGDETVQRRIAETYNAHGSHDLSETIADEIDYDTAGDPDYLGRQAEAQFNRTEDRDVSRLEPLQEIPLSEHPVFGDHDLSETVGTAEALQEEHVRLVEEMAVARENLESAYEQIEQLPPAQRPQFEANYVAVLRDLQVATVGGADNDLSEAASGTIYDAARSGHVSGIDKDELAGALRGTGLDPEVLKARMQVENVPKALEAHWLRQDIESVARAQNLDLATQEGREEAAETVSRIYEGLEHRAAALEMPSVVTAEGIQDFDLEGVAEQREAARVEIEHLLAKDELTDDEARRLSQALETYFDRDELADLREGAVEPLRDFTTPENRLEMTERALRAETQIGHDRSDGLEYVALRMEQVRQEDDLARALNVASDANREKAGAEAAMQAAERARVSNEEDRKLAQERTTDRGLDHE